MNAALPIRGAITLLCLLAAACASTPTRFYTLVPLPAASPDEDPGYVIDVQAVSLPSQVDQPQFVIRQGQGEVALAEQHQWIAPLPDEYRSALAAHLSRQLGAPDVFRAPKSEGTTVYAVRARVQRFDSQLSRSAHQQVIWSLTPPSGEALITCTFSREESAKGGYLELAEAHQRLVMRLASAIAAPLSDIAQGRAAACP